MDPNESSLGGDLLARGVGVVSDVGADLLDVPLSAVNAVRGAAGASRLPTFRSILDGEAPEQPTQAQAQGRGGGRMPLPAGVVPSEAGGGRGLVDHPLRLDMDPSRPSLGAMRDFGKELASVPAELPADLRSGVVFKTKDANGRTVYSGRDVAAGAQMVDGLGRRTGVLSDATFENKGLPGPTRGRPGAAGNPGGVSDGELAMQRNLRAAEIMRAGREAQEAGFAANQPGGGLSGMTTRSLVDDVVARGRTSPLEKEMRTMSPIQRAETARMMAQLGQRREEAEMGNAATLRGQDINASVATRGQDIGAGTARRGQDMDYAEKIDARMMDLMARRQLRDAVGQAFALSKGDPRAAAAYLAANGLDPDNALKIAKYNDERLAAGDKQLSTVVAPQSIGPDGKISEGAVATNRVVAKQSANLTDATPEQVAAAEPRINSTLKLLGGFNAARNNGLLQAAGFDEPSLEYRALPNLDGYTMSETGFFDGAATPGASEGDFKFSKRGEKPIYLRRDGLDEADLKLLRDQFRVGMPR